MSFKKYLLILSYLSLAIFLTFSLGFGSISEIKQKIENYKKKIREEKKILNLLSEEERKSVLEISNIDNQIIEIEKKLEQEEEVLEDIKDKEKKLISDYKIISDKKENVKKELENILNNFWPIYLKQKDSSILDYKNEEEYKLKSKWLKIILNKINEKYKTFSYYSEQLTLKLIEIQNTISQKEKQLARINQEKDSLLAKKLEFLKKIEETRLVKLKQEEHIQEILSVVEELNYKFLILTSRDFAKTKGNLIWPAHGKVKIDFNLKSNPPQRGIGIILKKDEPIRAVFWGKVVHTDLLRGFGRVVIISHGNGYYTLYSFLSQSLVRLGQEVEQGEIIGLCGFYPQIKNYGLYFELRFKQKPVNPLEWLKHIF
ncbi:MAG TPA: hypothetical protein DIT19_01695 [Desulfonauticus sp.]|nr:MAG: Peptidase M23 [Desulfonauticus sp. 38_4375]HCO11927.1 hypothetical protein [Desulfonauticus sp.]